MTKKKEKKPKSGKKFGFSFGKKKKADDDDSTAETNEDPIIEDDAKAGDDNFIPALDDEGGDDDDLFGGEGLFEEVKAYVNLGATTMDLAIGKQGGVGKVGFCRSIPHAGNGWKNLAMGPGARSGSSTTRLNSSTTRP